PSANCQARVDRARPNVAWRTRRWIARAAGGRIRALMAGVAFGRFTLIDLHGESLGEVIIAPEYILLQRGAAGPARDVSYLALWSAARLQAIENELAALAL